jgi:hypothetical protein
MCICAFCVYGGLEMKGSGNEKSARKFTNEINYNNNKMKK